MTSPLSRRDLALLAAVTLIAGLLLGFYFSRHYTGRLGSIDAMEYWGYARHLLDGDGLVRTHLQVPELSAHGPRPVALETERLLFPALAAAAFLLVRDWSLVLVLVSCLCAVLLFPLLFLIGRALCGPYTGLLAVLLYLFNPALYDLAPRGLSETFFTVLLLSCVLALCREDLRGRFLLGGLFFALSALCRPVGPFFLLPFLFVVLSLSPSGRRVKNLLLFFLPYFLLPPAAAWLNGLLLAPGAVPRPYPLGPHYLLFYTPLSPGGFLLKFPALPDGILRLALFNETVRASVLEKIAANAGGLLTSLPADLLENPVLGLLALSALVFPGLPERLRPWKKWLALGLLFNVLFLILAVNKRRYLFPLGPMSALMAAALLARLSLFLPAARLRNAACLAAAGAFCALSPVTPGFFRPVPPAPNAFNLTAFHDWYFNASARRLRPLVPPGAFVMAASPMMMDFFLGGRCVCAFYPASIRDFAALHAAGKAPCDILHFDSYSVSPSSERPEWLYLFDRPAPFLGFVPAVHEEKFSDRTLRSVTYVRDSLSEAAKSLSRAEDPALPLPARLRAAALALAVRPGDPRALKTLSGLDALCAARAEKYLAAARTSGEAKQTFSALGAAAALRPLLPAESALLPSGSAPSEPLSPALSLSCFPCGPEMTDRNPETFLSTTGADAVLDFGSPHRVDSVAVLLPPAARTPAHHGPLRSLSVWISSDGLRWTPVPLPPLPAGPKLSDRVEFNGLNLCTPFVRLSFSGDGMRPFCIAEISVRGRAAPQPPPS